jgi:hypothetical protein
MSPDRKRVLALLAEGKITADEADRLLSALEAPGRPGPDLSAKAPAARAPKYMHVTVDAHEGGETPTKVNIRVPLQLLRAGVRLGGLMPPQARDKINESLRRQGVAIDINQVRPENLDVLLDQIGDLTLDVDNDRAKVRIFCE